MASSKQINTFISGKGYPKFDADFGWVYEDTDTGKRYRQITPKRGHAWKLFNQAAGDPLDLSILQAQIDALEAQVNTVVISVGNIGYTIISLIFADSPYTVLPIDGTTLYLVDCTGGNIIMNFPSAVANSATYGVKKIDATLNTITLTPNGIETIDGAATQTIRFQWTEIDIFSDGTELLLK